MINCKDQWKEFCKVDDLLTYTEFRKIIRSYNEKIMERIISGESFSFDHNIGSLKFIVTNVKHLKKSIDWKASNEKKAVLIAKGRVPKKGDNGGENWHIYRVNERKLNFYWNRYRYKTKNGNMHFPLRRIRNYHLFMTQGNCRSLYRENRKLIEDDL